MRSCPRGSSVADMGLKARPRPGTRSSRSPDVARPPSPWHSTSLTTAVDDTCSSSASSGPRRYHLPHVSRATQGSQCDDGLREGYFVVPLLALAVCFAGGAFAQSNGLEAAPNPNLAFASLVSNWATDNEWVGKSGSHNLPVILLPIAVTNTTGEAAPVMVHFGCGFFEVQTIYSNGEAVLRNCSVTLFVPIWGRAQLLAPQDVPLNASSSIPVAIPGVMNGTLAFYLKDDEVLMGWVLDTPFIGTLDESGLSVFPTSINVHFTPAQLKDVRQFTQAELQQLAKPSIPSIVPPTNNITANGELLKGFFEDFLVSSINGTFAVQTMGENQYHVEESFLGIFSIDGSIDPTSLTAAITPYVRIPVSGRVSLAELNGNLLDAGSGPVGGVFANISVVLAQGYVALSARPAVGPDAEGLHDLYIDANLNISMIGVFNTLGPIKVLSLPF
uniref:Uncharacterized protein n=1 Tax=Mycena chlorophos TaxID=658473 RepID=A0ABQ0LTU0_MYCCL|nr:predicted protein [Mycena chlorophos]